MISPKSDMVDGPKRFGHPNARAAREARLHDVHIATSFTRDVIGGDLGGGAIAGFYHDQGALIVFNGVQRRQSRSVSYTKTSTLTIRLDRALECLIAAPK